MRLKRAQARNILFLVLGVFLIASIFAGTTIISQQADAINITNATVTTRVFVWNTEPNLYNVTVTPNPVVLSPDNTTVVNCTGLFFDYNGYLDVAGGEVNATFFDSTSSFSSDNDDNNEHYTNHSCRSTCSAIAGSNGQNGTCSCTFNVQYYANASTWTCNMSIFDSGINITDNSRNKTFNSSLAASTTVAQLLALDVPPVIDFGNLSVTETSDPIRENVTNVGNTPFNVSVRGYGGDDEVAYANLSMICELGNITISAERFSSLNSTPYANMTNLTQVNQQLANLTVKQRQNDNNKEEGLDVNTTFWRIQIPLSVGGQCNGTVIFTAVPP